MGAADFYATAPGKTAQEAFENARRSARHFYGHRPYTGSVAEKHTFVMIEAPEGQEPKAYAKKLVDEDDRRVANKFGPAGCIKLTDGEYLFFGWASY